MTALTEEKTVFCYDGESDLLRRVADGDRKAFAVVYSRYLDEVYRYVYLFTKSKERSEDIVQTVFVKVWEQRGSLLNVVSFKSYIFRCAKNQLLDEVRRDQVKQKVFSALTPADCTSLENPESKVVYQQYYQITQEAIDLLPKKRKLIVQMRTRDQLSLDEIAERLSISKNVVKKQLYSGLAFVREYFEKNAELTSVILLVLFLAQNFSI